MTWFRAIFVIVLLAATIPFGFAPGDPRLAATTSAAHQTLGRESIASLIDCCRSAKSADHHRASYNDCCFSMNCSYSGLLASAESFSPMRSPAHRPELLVEGALVGRNIAPETGPPKFVA